MLADRIKWNEKYRSHDRETGGREGPEGKPLASLVAVKEPGV
jgi:hypothetical protein